MKTLVKLTPGSYVEYAEDNKPSLFFQMVVRERSVGQFGRVDVLHVGRGRVLPRGRDGQEGQLRLSRDVTQHLVWVEGKTSDVISDVLCTLLLSFGQNKKGGKYH